VREKFLARKTPPTKNKILVRRKFLISNTPKSGSVTGSGSSRVADVVVEEIRKSGGSACANYNSVVDGEAIIKTALDVFGRIDIIINNAGILRDKSFHKMENNEWDSVQHVHVTGAKNVTRAAWSHFRKQKYGRVVFVTSTSGLYGNFGQSNYSAAKMAVIGLANTLALEGKKYNIKVNTIAPTAFTRMTDNLNPMVTKTMEKNFPAKSVTRAVSVLASEQCPSTAGIYEVQGNYVARTKIIRSKGAILSERDTAEDLLKVWSEVEDFEDYEDPWVVRKKTGVVWSARAYRTKKTKAKL